MAFPFLNELGRRYYLQKNHKKRLFELNNLQLGYDHLIKQFKKEIKIVNVFCGLLPESVNASNYSKFYLWNEFGRLYRQKHFENEMDHFVMGSSSQFMN